MKKCTRILIKPFIHSLKNIETDIIKNISSDVNVLTLRKDNILTLVPHMGATRTNIETIEFELETFTEWTAKTGPLPLLVDVRYMKQMTTEERVYIQKNSPLIATKLAIIVKEGLPTFFFNLMTLLNTPTIPIKAYSDYEKAIKWLKKTE